MLMTFRLTAEDSDQAPGQAGKMWLGLGLILPLAHLLCPLVQLTLLFYASVSWAQ